MRSLSIILVAAGVLALASSPAPAADAPEPAGAVFGGSFLLGYGGGPGGQVGLTASEFARGLPFAVRLGVGYRGTDPGNALAARANFINDNTNGTPEESGRVWDFRFDFLVPVNWFDFGRSYLVFGPRHARFKGTFDFIGGNEKFEVTSNSWALGAGMESHFAMSARTDFVLAAGLDYYFDATLTGHDTSYAPDGEEVNGRQDYDYSTADEAINEPELEVNVMLGVGYRL